MQHCLNKRDSYHAPPQIDVEKEVPQELQKVRRLTSNELPHGANARRRPDVTGDPFPNSPLPRRMEVKNLTSIS